MIITDITKLRPLQDRVLVKIDPANDKTKGGIIIPDNAKEKLTRGTVIAVGPGKYGADGKLIEPRVRQGDVVLYGKYSGSEFQDADRNDYLLCTEDTLYGVFEE